MRVVMKFGGGVLRDAEGAQRVAAIVAGCTRSADGDQCVLVVSALYGLTDFLLAAAEQVARDASQVETTMEHVIARHAGVLTGITDPRLRDEVQDAIRVSCRRLEQALKDIANRGEITAPDHDFVGSYGERLAAILVSGFLRDAGVNSQPFDAESIGMVTDGRCGGATPLIPQIQRNLDSSLVPHITAGMVPVVTGFYGVDVTGKVTTFGRGGSDFSAAILAGCLNAGRLEQWKDVAGYMTTNPRVVPAARFVTNLSYDEVEELSYFGAEILHPRTVGPLRKAEIQCAIRSVLDPENPGTVISPQPQLVPSVAKSVAAKRNIVLVTMKGAVAADVPGFAGKAFSAINAAGVSVDAIATSQTDISFTIHEQDLPRTADCLNALQSDCISRWYYNADVALVAIVGQGLRNTPGVAGRLFSCVARVDPPINIEMISQGGSEISISFVVPRSRVDDAIRAVHAEFFESAP